VPIVGIAILLAPIIGPWNEYFNPDQFAGDIFGAYQGNPSEFKSTVAVLKFMTFASDAALFVANLDKESFVGKAAQGSVS
jgi:hypothetical protein